MDLFELMKLIVGLFLLVGGAELLVRGGGRLALALRVPVIIVGLTIVAFGTSMPELMVSIQAAREHSTEMALANVTGSNIANIALVLGCAAMVRPLEVGRDLLYREVPTVLLLQLVVPLMIVFDMTISRVEGAILLLLGITYNVVLVRDAMSGRAPYEPEDDLDEGGGVVRNFALLVGGIALLVFGAGWFVDGAVGFAEWLGVSQRVIGLTVVALGTSAPEVMTSVVSAYRGETDMAIGNSLGSNILNIAMVLGITAMVAPIEVHDSGAWSDLSVAILVTALLVPLVVRGRGLSRIEGAVMVAVYCSDMVWVGL